MQKTFSELDHLKQDTVLLKVINTYGVLAINQSKDTFRDIVESITSQQLSVKAADTIFTRVEKLLGEVTPANILKTESQDLRNCGLSWSKVSYIKDLATKVSDDTLQLDKLTNMTDEEVIEHLVQVKGIGRWSAEMILMFTLKRPDILPLDDLGIQNAFVKLYGLNRSHKTLRRKMEKIAKAWIPYRTLACRYLWKSLDNTPITK
jgi:DNA-3-methyladenine glycosylase II